MSVFKCKMCGGDLQIEAGATVAECEYCGTKQTLPRLNDERIANLYDRANHLRRNNEFDKAMSIYEKILIEDSTDAEAYWSLVLCRFGIEYVEDPQSHRRVPTVNRAQFTSIFDDDNYKSAIKNADASRRAIYEAEAKVINEIQKNILSISQKEEPFDVFVCYKETDRDGRRTPDSVLAQELYFQLKNEGFKVFFSRITLEDKLGTAYEPYIFAALNSAKVMVVVGTKPEYFNAVWVKNEWSRYLALIKKGEKKTLVPAYKDMDPYDLPEEFSHLQAQDMSKLGFMQDLIRGIKKIVKKDAKKESTQSVDTKIQSAPAPVSGSIAPLLRRAFMFLEDGEFDSANEYCERVLDAEPENAEAYLGKLLVDLKLTHRDALAETQELFTSNSNYKRIMLYGDDNIKAEVSGYLDSMCRHIYEEAQVAMDQNTVEHYGKAVVLLKQIPEYFDSKDLIEKCKIESDLLEKEAAYNQALGLIATNSAMERERAVLILKELADYKDAPDIISDCKKQDVYDSAMFDLSNGNMNDAYQKFEMLNGWKDSNEHMQRINAHKRMRRITILSVVSVIIALAVIFSFVGIVRSLSRSSYGRQVARQELTSFSIPYGTNKIGASDFKNCTTLETVDIPQGVKKIGNRAFAGCTALESVIIPSSVDTIGAKAFAGCTNLEFVYLPSGVSVADSAFEGCHNLKAVICETYAYFSWKSNLPSGCTFYENVSNVVDCGMTASGLIWVGRKSNNDASTTVSIIAYTGSNSYIEIPWQINGYNVTAIGEGAFKSNDCIMEVALPNGVKSIGDSAFQGCYKLTSITMPNSLTYIGDSAFDGCASLTKIVIPSSVTSVGLYAFDDCYKLQIYCRASYEGSGWEYNWNPDKRPVVWKYTG